MNNFFRRMALQSRLRGALAARGYAEVMTACLQESAGTDAEIEPFTVEYQPLMEPAPAGRVLHLHTSPEFAMKRLLCRGVGPIFQIGPAFRQGECGPLHAPEFCMAEWYRPGWTWRELMAEVEELTAEVCAGRVTAAGREVRLEPPFPRLTLAEAFAAAGFRGREYERISDKPESREEFYYAWVDTVEPWLAGQGAVFLTDFPPALAMLAQLAPDGRTAERFELIVAGIELANGATELTDPAEYRRRFDADRAARAATGKPATPLPAAFLHDLDHPGLPPCAGVALGVDRLAMLAVGASRIDEVQAFPFLE